MTQNRFAIARNSAPADVVTPAPVPEAFIACPPTLMPGVMAAGPAAFLGFYGVYQEAYRRAYEAVQKQERISRNGRENAFAVARVSRD